MDVATTCSIICLIVCERGDIVHYKFDAQNHKPLDWLDLMVEIWCKSFNLHLVSTDPDSYIYIYIYIYIY